ncbi:MAG: NAD(P)-binding protein, partial [Pseudomonadota bacterium]
MTDFDAIVIGSGMSGGWAAKELCEKGLKTLVLERGRHLDHPSQEYTDFQAPWDLDHRGMVPEIYDEQGRYRMLKRKGWT